MTSVLPIRFDADDPSVLDNPYPTYAELRRAGRLCRAGPAQWGVTRYDDVAALLRHPGLGHQFPDEFYRFQAGDGPTSEFFRRVILDRDPPEHTRLRQLMGKAFRQKPVKAYEELVARLVDELLEPVRERGRFDVVSDFAFHLPVLVICQVLGVPPEDRLEVAPRAADLARAFTDRVVGQEREAADNAIVWLREYVGRTLQERRRRPGDDLLSAMLAAEEQGETLSFDEIVDNAVFLYFAGFDTTKNLISTGCAALLDHPAEHAKLRATPALAESAVDEFLRYDAPIQSTARLVIEPLEIAGRTLRTDRIVVLLVGSANHDETKFEHPERLDISRSPNRHLSFGGGIHHCLGATLARLEATVAFERMARLFRRFEAAGPAIRRRHSSFRGFASLPIVVAAA